MSASPAVQHNNIPEELQELPQWVGWKKLLRRGARSRKMPVSLATGEPVDVTDPAAWSSWEDALEMGGKYDGIGFVLAEGDPIIGVDLDGCRDPKTGRIEPWAEEIVRELDSYTEVSPSGTGLRIFAEGELDGNRRKGNVEVYSAGQFLTVTGRRLPGTAAGVARRQAELERLYESLRPDGAGGGELRDVPGRTDEEVVAAARRAANGAKFDRLWAGDRTGYRSQSDADMALCNFLVYHGATDPEQVERLFDESGLGKRKKWTGREDYRRSTIRKAIESARSFTRGHTEEIQTERVSTGAISPPGSPLGEVKVRKRRGRGKGAEEIAIELAAARGQAPDYETSFELARKLRGLSDGGPEEFEGAIAAFCERAAKNFDEFYYMVEAAWPKVRFAEWEKVLACAVEEAAAHPLTSFPRPKVLPSYVKLASIAYHLSRYQGEDPFFLPRTTFAPIMGMTPQGVSAVVQVLEKDGLIKCVDENCSYVKKKAKAYVWIGGRPSAG